MKIYYSSEITVTGIIYSDHFNIVKLAVNLKHDLQSVVIRATELLKDAKFEER